MMQSQGRRQYSSRQLAVLAAAVLFFVALQTGCCDALKYPTWKGSVKGDVLVPEINSMHWLSPRSMSVVIDVATCRDACKALPGCNAYSFCNSTTGDGCGSGCSNYEQVNFPIIPGVPYIDASKVSLPVKGFGQYSGSPCKGDKWRVQTCTLKKVADPSKPTFMSKKDGEGWVSGTIKAPYKCEGIATKICEGCLVSGDFDKCLACAKPLRQYSFDGFSGYDTPPAKACTTCASKLPKGSAAQDSCVACYVSKHLGYPAVSDKAPECTGCLKVKGSASLATRCFQCAAKLDSSTTLCIDCFAPGIVKRHECLACIEDPNLPPGAARAYCHACARRKSAAERSKCFACVAMNPKNPDATC